MRELPARFQKGKWKRIKGGEESFEGRELVEKLCLCVKQKAKISLFVL